MGGAAPTGRPRAWLLAPRRVAGEPWPYRLPGVGGALAYLDAHGIRPGARIALGAAATPACMALLQAAGLRGCTVVLLGRRLGEPELRRQLEEAAVDHALADPAHPLAPRAGAVVPTTFPDADPPARARHQAHGEAGLVLFTSGTSGRARAARLGVGALTAAAVAASERLALGEGIAWLGCLSLDHVGGASLAYRAMVSGCQVLLQERFEPGATSALLGEVDGASLVPTMLHRLIVARAAAPWPTRLARLLIGGGPLSDALAGRAAALGREPVQSYGLTESGALACAPATPARAERGGCGTPLPGLALAVRRADGSDAPPGEAGQIHLRGPQLFAGYETAGRLSEPLEPGAWFATGDIGERDASGRLTVHCRRDDLILSGGENIYPAVVEAALEANPAVAEAGVCPVGDPEWGQVVAAAVVLRPGAAFDPERLAAWVAEHLSPLQRPRRWIACDALPRTESGKLQRRLLAARFEA